MLAVFRLRASKPRFAFFYIVELPENRNATMLTWPLFLVIETEFMPDDGLCQILVFVNMMSSTKQEFSFRRLYPRGTGLNGKSPGDLASHGPGANNQYPFNLFCFHGSP